MKGMSLKDIDKSTCWYSNSCAEQIRQAVENRVWAPLEECGHYACLLKLLETAAINGCKTMIDVGCGAAALQQIPYVREHFTATGVDFPIVIEKTAKPLYKEGNFIECDIVDEKNDISFLGNYDLVVMNGFIDIMQYPLEVLERILKHCRNYVLLHRQYLTDDPTYLTKHGSYGGVSYASHINKTELEHLLEKMGIGPSRICLPSNEEWPDNYSFLWRLK